jgi:hypothetical protein
MAGDKPFRIKERRLLVLVVRDRLELAKEREQDGRNRDFFKGF